MSTKAALPLDTDAYLADTGHLTTTEHGAYLLIIMAIWRSENGWIQGDDRYLANVTHLTMDKWRKISPTIRPLLRVDGKKVTQKRTLKEHRLNPPRQNPRQDSREEIGNGSKSLNFNAPNSETTRSAQHNGLDEKTHSFLPSLDSENQKEERKKTRARGAPLPADWQPSAKLFEYGRGLGLTDAESSSQFETMRSWAKANANRSVAKKADWDATAEGWLRRTAEKKQEKSNGNGFSGRGREFGSSAEAAGRHAEAAERGEFTFGPRPGSVLPAAHADAVGELRGKPGQQSGNLLGFDRGDTGRVSPGGDRHSDGPAHGHPKRNRQAADDKATAKVL